MQLSLLWGVTAYYYDKFDSTDQTIKDINQHVVDHKYAKKSDYVINLASMPIEEKGMVNTLRVSKIK